jgi:hypothetical protein
MLTVTPPDGQECLLLRIAVHQHLRQLGRRLVADLRGPLPHPG